MTEDLNFFADRVWFRVDVIPGAEMWLETDQFKVDFEQA
jgi:hypothetical protein